MQQKNRVEIGEILISKGAEMNVRSIIYKNMVQLLFFIYAHKSQDQFFRFFFFPFNFIFCTIDNSAMYQILIFYR